MASALMQDLQKVPKIRVKQRRMGLWLYTTMKLTKADILTTYHERALCSPHLPVLPSAVPSSAPPEPEPVVSCLYLTVLIATNFFQKLG